MNTYKIIFTRENGTQGTDHFTAINECQARKDFGECYRHSTATIISISKSSLSSIKSCIACTTGCMTSRRGT